MKDYKPLPIDTQHVVLPESIEQLTEKLAENAHEQWSQQRLKDGWRYGQRRDDERKEHPCLVPYSDLPDSERVYDRRTAMETLKAIMALGYRIVPPA